MACAALLAVEGCSGSGSNGGDDDDDAATTLTPTPTPTPVSGVHITSDTTWSNAVAVAENTIVDPGVTLTIASNATVTFASQKQLRVEGTLLVNGLASAPVTLTAAVPAQRWGGILSASGGSVTIRNATFTYATTGLNAAPGALESSLLYASFQGVNTPLSLHADTRVCRNSFGNGSGSSIVDAGAITISDTAFTGGSGGDSVVFSGSADIAIDHAHFGTQWHCLLHGGGAGTAVTVVDSQFDDASYAFDISSLGSVAAPAQIHNSSILLGTGGLQGTSGGTTNVVNAENNYWGTGDGSFAASGQTVPAGWDVIPDLPTAPAGIGPRAAGAGCEATF